MDFSRDPEAFSGYLNTVKRDWTGAAREFMGLLEHWQTITKQYYPDLVEIGAGEEANTIKGKVLGKAFLLELIPLAKDQVGYAEAVLSTSNSARVEVEIGRFLVRRDGTLVGADGDVLTDPMSNMYSYKIFTTILRDVVETPAAVKGV